MQPFLADIFFFATYHLDSFECEIKREIDRRGKDSPMTSEEIERARVRLRTLEHRCQHLELTRTVEHLSDIEAQFAVYDVMPEYSVTLRDMEYRLTELRRYLVRDLGSQMLMTIPAPDAGYFEQEQLFGPEVFDSFYTTRDDVKEAGNCYATGRYTACAFHCARVAEKGLHALARDINNKFGVVISFGSKDIERVNWGTLIEKIEAEIRKLIDPNREPRIAPNDLVFYSQAAKEFTYLKNGWRDEISHSRTFYTLSSEAKFFMDQVKAFMTHLAKEGLTEYANWRIMYAAFEN